MFERCKDFSRRVKLYEDAQKLETYVNIHRTELTDDRNLRVYIIIPGVKGEVEINANEKTNWKFIIAKNCNQISHFGYYPGRVINSIDQFIWDINRMAFASTVDLRTIASLSENAKNWIILNNYASKTYSERLNMVETAKAMA